MLLFLHGCLIPGKYIVNLFCTGLEAGEELSLLLLNAQSGADSQRPSLSNILGNPGKPDHMINDVFGDVEACMQIALFLWCFGVLKVNKIVRFSVCFGSLHQDGGMALQYR